MEIIAGHVHDAARAIGEFNVQSVIWQDSQTGDVPCGHFSCSRIELLGILLKNKKAASS